VTNVSITPYTYTEDFTGNETVLSRDIAIGDAVLARVRAYAEGSPFVINSVVVGNVQYPAEVADAVSRKLAVTQELQRKDTEIEIERKERTKREVQAQGIANATAIIRGQLNAMYIQHEAIEAQKAMVNSQNHTVVYIPVGPMGVPITERSRRRGATSSP
jgi:regulator of protease activity HflC (stomatin/prohibitin superfamily)